MIMNPIVRAHKLFEAKSKFISTIESLTNGKGKKYVTLKALQQELDLDDAAFTDVMKGAYDANRHSNKYIMTHVDDEPAIGITAQKRKKKVRNPEGLSTNGSVGLATGGFDIQRAKEMENQLEKVKEHRENELWTVYKKEGWRGLDRMGVLKEGWQQLSDKQLIDSIVNEESAPNPSSIEEVVRYTPTPKYLASKPWKDNLRRVLKKDSILHYNNFGSYVLEDSQTQEDTELILNVVEIRELWQTMHASLIVALAALQRWEAIEKMARLPQSDMGASDLINDDGAIVDIHIVRYVLQHASTIRVWYYGRRVNTVENHIEYFNNGKFSASDLLKGAVDLDPSEEYLVDEAVEGEEMESFDDNIPTAIAALKRLDRKLGLPDHFWKSLSKALTLNNITTYLDFVDMVLSKELIQFDIERGAEDANEAVVEWIETMWKNMHIELIKALLLIGKKDIVEKLGTLRVSTEMLYSNESASDATLDENIIRTLLRTKAVIRVWHGNRFVKLSELMDAGEKVRYVYFGDNTFSSNFT